MTEPQKKYYDPLDDFLDRPIAYNPVWKRITGSTVGAVFFSQVWYWTKRHREDDGWFWKTQKEWEEETGLTRSEQETARKHCKQVGILEEDLRGVPATMYYRANRSKVYDLLGIQFAGFPQSSFSANSQFAEKQQSENPANIKRNPETPPMNPDIYTDDQKTEDRKKVMRGLELLQGGTLNAMSLDFVNTWLEKHTAEWVLKAFEVAQMRGGRHAKYVDKILVGWEANGYPKSREKQIEEARKSPGASSRAANALDLLRR